MKFSTKEAISFGWEIAKKNIMFFVGLLLIVILIFLPFRSLRFPPFYNEFVATIFSFLISTILEMGLIRIWLNFSTNVQSKFSDLFSQYRLFFTFLFADILYNLIISLGLILFIIPGIFLSVRLSFFKYFIIDKKSNILESLKESWRVTQGNFWNLFLLYILCFLIEILGFIFLFVGLFWAIPTAEIAKAFVYQKLKQRENQVQEIN